MLKICNNKKEIFNCLLFSLKIIIKCKNKDYKREYLKIERNIKSLKNKLYKNINKK